MKLLSIIGAAVLAIPFVLIQYFERKGMRSEIQNR